MRESETSQDTGSWKSKYFDCLGDLEQRERDWKALEALLRDAMAHMCVALEGQDTELDGKLARLRRQLRDGHVNAEAVTMTRTVTETLDRLERARRRKGGRHSLRPLRGLFGRSSPRDDQAPGPAQPAMQPSASEALLQLLERLDLPPEVEHNRESIQQRLESNPSEADWPGLVADLAELIAAVRRSLQREKQEIGRFLAQLTERLTQLDTCVRSVDSDRSEALNSGRQLDAAVQEQVQGIHSSVREAVDLDQLKQQVQQRLEAIGRHMEAFRHSEESRSRQAEQRIQELNDRLQELEQESGELQDRIRRERQLALVDTLTGVPNRMAYEERAEQEYNRWQRFGEPLALVLLDVDNFKAVNDNYGHKAGDRVLKTIGQLVAEKLRVTDFVARYGGEEFVLLLPGADTDSALEVSDKLRDEIRNCGFHYRGNSVRITVSCGIACFAGGDGIDDVFERADRAMYRAKDQGRDRCVTHCA